VYETFGFSQWADGRYGFQLFVPDNTIDPSQYTVGDVSRIASVGVVGTFQPPAGVSTTIWDTTKPLMMAAGTNAHGLLFSAALPQPIPDGYYEYKYWVTFQNGSTRWVGDPCTKYGGTNSDNSAFVIGGSDITVTPLDPAKRLSGEDLVLYELMIDDFTANFRGTSAPVDAVVTKLSYLQNLGINGIEFMPWIAWPDSDGFSWGYDPAYFFSAEYNYVTDPATPLEKLSRLGDMISACHAAGLMVVLDIVLQHASDGSTQADPNFGTGFPYKWLWQDPQQSPFIVANASTPGGVPLNYVNQCTLDFITDVCKYWIDTFSVDGFRFDQVSGFDNVPSQGAKPLMSNLKTYLATLGNTVFPLIIEDHLNFDDINDTNTIQSTHCWFDMFRSSPVGSLGYGNSPQPPYMRVLNAALDFNFPIGPMIYIEDHDHSTVTNAAGGRNNWFRVQPYMIALATCSGGVMIHNGQEFATDYWFPEPNASGRVMSRPLDWTQAADATGVLAQSRYQSLLQLRNNHAGLRTPNFYPDYYDEQWFHFSPDGYGLNVDQQVIIYHRWGNSASGQLERFMVVLNFSWQTQYVAIPFPANGQWTDLLNGNATVTIGNYWLQNYPVNSYWGCIFYLQG
jgi:hypothetical protein